MAKTKIAPKETVITGLVEEITLENGKPGLQLDDGDDIYLVMMDREGKKLLDCIDEEVEVRGVVSGQDDQHQIKIRHFRLINDYRDVGDDSDLFSSDMDDYYNERD